MALPSGLAAQIGWAEETTWGTPVTVDTFAPLVSESIGFEKTRLESSGIISGRTILDTDQVKAGNRTVSGDIQLEAYEQSIGTVLKHALGTVSTTGSGPYTHTITPGDLTGLGLTVQVGRPDVGGTVRPYTFSGCKVESVELAIAAGEIATLGVSVVGKDVATNTALASVSYAAQASRPFTGIEATTSTWGGGALEIKQVSLSIANNLDADRRFLGTDTIDEPLQAELRTIDGSLEVEFSSLALWEDFASLTYRDLIVTATNSVESLSYTVHARRDGVEPQVGGRGLVTTDIPYVVSGDGSDADAVTIVYTSDDATI